MNEKLVGIKTHTRMRADRLGNETMKTYTANGMRSVHADSFGDAAEMFARRLARREFGRSAEVRTCNIGSYSTDGRCVEVSAFVGRPGVGPERGSTVGHNVNFTVFVG